MRSQTEMRLRGSAVVQPYFSELFIFARKTYTKRGQRTIVCKVMLDLYEHNDSLDTRRDPQNTVFSYQFHVNHQLLFCSVSSRRRASNRAEHFCLKEAMVAQL